MPFASMRVPHLVLSSTIPIPPAPVLDPFVDAGTLFLWDGSHPADPTISAANGAVMPNLAWPQLVEKEQIGNKESWSAKVDNRFTSSARGFVERTSKGGLHFAASQTVDVVGELGGITLGSSIISQINKAILADHTIYMSMMLEVTRLAVSAQVPIRINDGSNNEYVGVRLTAGGNIEPRPIAGASGHLDSWASTTFSRVTRKGLPAGWSGNINPLIAFSGPGGSNSLHTTPSFIIRRILIEDLTAANLTVDAMNTKDYNLQTSLMNAGGRYNGDTWSTPVA